MMLSDAGIVRAIAKSEIGINPYSSERLQPASLDFTLGDVIQRFRGSQIIDVKDDQSRQFVREQVSDWFVMQPGEFVLACTRESVRFGRSVAGRMDGKSSLGRLGLTVHVTAGFFDPGFEGYPTLELVNHAPVPIRLYPGMTIAQMSFFRLNEPATQVYGQNGSKYQGQPAEPVVSRYHLNFVESQ